MCYFNAPPWNSLKKPIPAKHLLSANSVLYSLGPFLPTGTQLCVSEMVAERSTAHQVWWVVRQGRWLGWFSWFRCRWSAPLYPTLVAFTFVPQWRFTFNLVKWFRAAFWTINMFTQKAELLLRFACLLSGVLNCVFNDWYMMSWPPSTCFFNMLGKMFSIIKFLHLDFQLWSHCVQY
jgi:hypothetical protein